MKVGMQLDVDQKLTKFWLLLPRGSEEQRRHHQSLHTVYQLLLLHSPSPIVAITQTMTNITVMT